MEEKNVTTIEIKDLGGLSIARPPTASGTIIAMNQL